MKVITKIEPSVERSIRKKLRVAAYCRVSTGMDDQLVSLEAQKSHYEDYIQGNPEWEYAGLYYDEGVSGTKKEIRPALMDMMRDCEEGKIDYIVTKSLSRFARNTTDCLELVRRLLDLGIPIYFEKENLDTGAMESELLLSIMSSLAESESVSISENSKWGVRHRFENGTFKIGYAPFGYTVRDGKFAVNEEEARWVRYIFEQALSGRGSGAIAKELNEKGVQARKGNHWTATTVRGILTNEKYIGDCLFQKTYSDFRFKRHVNRGEKDQFYMEGHHEAIISKEDFEAVEQLLSQRAKEKNIKKGDPRYQNRYPFTGRIICGECGSPFKRRINYTGNIKYPAWVCREHIDNIANCSMKYVREEVIERAFLTMINKLVFGRMEVLQPLLEGMRGQAQKKNLKELSRIQSQLDAIAEQEKTLTTIMTQGYLEPALFAQERNDLSARAEALEDEKERAAQGIKGELKKSENLAELMKFVNTETMHTEFDANVFLRFVDRMTICSRKEIIFHLKCGLNLKERMV